MKEILSEILVHFLIVRQLKERLTDTQERLHASLKHLLLLSLDQTLQLPMSPEMPT